MVRGFARRVSADEVSTECRCDNAKIPLLEAPTKAKIHDPTIAIQAFSKVQQGSEGPIFSTVKDRQTV